MVGSPDHRPKAPRAHPDVDMRLIPELYLRRGIRGVLGAFVEMVTPLVSFDDASLALVDAGRKRLRIFGPTAKGTAEAAGEDRSVPLGGTAAAAALKRRTPVVGGVAGEGMDAFHPLFPGSSPQSALVVPLWIGERPLGTLNLGSGGTDGFDGPSVIELNRLAPLLSVAVENASRYLRVRHSEDRYRALLENAADAVLVLNLDERRLVEVNARAVELTGFSRSELMAMDLEEYRVGLEWPSGDLRRLLRDGRVRFETRLARADGNEIQVSLEASLIHQGATRMVHCELREHVPTGSRNEKALPGREVVAGLLDGDNSFFCTLDPQGRVDLFNRKFQKATGNSAEEVRGTEAAWLVPPRMRAIFRDRLRAATQGRGLVGFEMPFLVQGGGEIILRLNSSPVRDEKGNFRELILLGADITDSKRFESDLVASEKRSKSSYQQLREFSAVSSTILQEKDLDRICRLFVQALREHSNYKRAILTLLDDEFRGYKWFFAGLSEEDIETFHRNRLTSDQRVTIFQERFRLGNSYYIAHDAGWNYVGVRSTREAEAMLDWHPDDFLFIPLYGSNRKMVGIVSVDDPLDGARPTAETISPIELFANQVAHSIEQAKLDQEVHRSTEKYRTLVDTMNNGLLAVDLTNHVTFVNPALKDLLGYSEHAVLNHSIHEFLSEVYREVFRREVRHRDRRSRFEVAMVARGGEEIPVLVSASPFYQNSQLVGTFAIISDLREQKKAELEFRKMHQEIVDANTRLQQSVEELRLTQEQLIQAEKLSALGELISGVAHELNNPLTGVMGYSQLLLGTESTEHVRPNLEKIHREAERCQKIVQNLLTFARRHVPEQGPVQVNEILDATLDLRSYQLKVDNVEVSRELDENLPMTTGDYHLLQQVFVNIINNAHQAMLEAHGRGRLVIRSESVGETIRILFIDDGPGIPDDKIGKIFDPFFTTKEVGKGTGLGLSLSYGIIKDHHGTIRAHPARGGGGTTFVVELPVREPDVPAEADTVPEDLSAELEGKRILVVDDEEVILELLGSILEHGGHLVDTACNGRMALEKVKENTYDLIISDIKMPDIGGQGLWESVRAINPELSRRMIFSTGDTVNPSTQAFFKKTGNHYLSKPFRVEEIDRTIRKALSEPLGSEN